MEFVELIKTPRVDNVVLFRPFLPKVEGTLCLTGHHLILSSRQDSTEELWLLHSNIDSIDKRFLGSLGTIIIKCKDLRIIQLDIPGMEECLNIASSIEALSTLDSTTLMYPFFYRPMFEVVEDGWHSFLPEQEFELLTSVVMMRSGQPLTGTNGRRCKEDEKLINATLRPGKRGYIIDTRALNVAQQARAKGGGFEQEAHYPQWRRIHRSIERSHILQESLIKLVEACNDQSPNVDRWLSKLEASNWLTYIKEILTTACLAAQCIDREAASVLVHGTEGIDSTLQVTSLAQIILDPNCRTIRGFEALIEREWLQVGECQFLGGRKGGGIKNFFARRKLKLQQKTVSLWSWVNRPLELEKFVNPLYEANSLVIWPSVAPQSLQLWEGVFLRWNRTSKYLDEAYEEMIHIIEYNKEMQAKVNALRRQLAELETEDSVQKSP
nr:PREDICTED: myotubularin-related protein 9 [Latimeria chalumnae]|eukprot:XP_014348177.1 PREDICTED: myotubularin-related protein 9 [Latimeria chalumnae]